MDTNNSPSNKYKKDVFRYAGLGSQLLVAIGIAVFLGLKADQWLLTSPLIACVLPLLVLSGIFYKLIRETGNNKKKDDPK